MDPQAFPATTVRTLGHERWKLENNGWNDLTQNWAFTLCAAFVHGHSKLVRLYNLSLVEVATQLRRSVAGLPLRIRAPDCPAPEPTT